MQPGATGVREHVEDVALGLGGVEAVAEVRGAEGAVLLPVRLPPRLDLVVRVRPPRLPRARVRDGAAAAEAASPARREDADGERGWPRVELERRTRRESHRGPGFGQDGRGAVGGCGEGKYEGGAGGGSAGRKKETMRALG